MEATDPTSRRRPRRWLSSTLILLGILVALGVIFAPRRRGHDTQPPDRAGAAPIISIDDPGKARLFARCLQCSPIRQWNVDFAGNGAPYRVERRHCDAQELSGFELPRSVGQISNANGELGYDVLLVFEPSRDGLIHGEIEEGSYGSVEQVRFHGREYFAMNGMTWGTSGDHDRCLLGKDSSGKIYCWKENAEELWSHVRGTLRADENLKPGWTIENTDGSLFVENYVEAKGDPNCCPSRGKIRVDLVPRSGQLHWAEVTRSGSPLRDVGEESPPDPEPAEVTALDLTRFPLAYGRRGHLRIVNWHNGIVASMADLKAGRSADVPAGIDFSQAPDDCKFAIFIGMGLPGGGCLSAAPEAFAPGPNLSDLITHGGRTALEFTIDEEFADLECQMVSDVWRCVLSPNSYYRAILGKRQHDLEMEREEKQLEQKQK